MKTTNVSPQCPSNSCRHVLLADDETDICRLNAEALRCSGYQVDTAEDGAAAWDALQLKSYDLLITDNQMPKVSGIELLQKLQVAQLPVPVIMVTGTMPTEVLNRNQWWQLKAVLLKPYALEQLLSMVRNVLQAKAGGHAQSRPSTVSLSA